MFTESKNFYPTPEKIIEKMLDGLDFEMIKSVLEPSAGKGDIVAALLRKHEKVDRWNYSPIDIDCIEIDENLQHILKGKKCRVVHNDFLTYNTLKEYDLIVMNPPFDTGCKHLLKALEMQERNGGAVICLLNAETLKNPYTNERKVLQQKLTDYGANVEFLQDAFIDAERKTAVEIALVKVQLPEVKRESFIFEGLKKARQESEFVQSESTGLIDGDFFRAIVNQYRLETEAGVKLIKEYMAMQPLILEEFKRDRSTGEVTPGGDCMIEMRVNSKDISVNGYIKAVRRKYWRALFNNPKFTGKLTGKLQSEFYNKVTELSDYDFSLYNIYQIKIEMNKSVVKGVEDAILELFEELSNKWHYLDETSKNIHYYNGWKTNKAWIINKKVIIPLRAFSTWSSRIDMYEAHNKLKDIEKCFTYLDGSLTSGIDLDFNLDYAERCGQTRNIECKYFTVTFYKKGTCHIVFKNMELLKKFNIFGSQRKGWLPPSYGKKAYSDMEQDEKAVINEFEGEAEYDKVMANKKYYLFDCNNMNLLDDKTA